VPIAAAVPASAPVPEHIDAAHWTAVVDGAKLSGMVRQFALNCVPASFDGVLLRLHFDSSAAHQRTRQSEEKLAQALSAYMGKEIRVAFESPAEVPVTPARLRVVAEQDRQARAAVAFEDDPAVKGLRERFGGQTDPSSVKPNH
jgi:hypothetical protein